MEIALCERCQSQGPLIVAKTISDPNMGARENGLQGRLCLYDYAACSQCSWLTLWGEALVADPSLWAADALGPSTYMYI